MRKISILSASLVAAAFTLLFSGTHAYAQSVYQNPLNIRVKAPDALLWLPGPVSFSSPEFVRDSLIYLWGKEQRATERGALAVADAELSVEYFMKRFGDAAGLSLSVESHPQTAILVESTLIFARSAISNAKLVFARERPYKHFAEPSAIPSDEDPEEYYESYPSGHTVRAWAIALALCAAMPEHSEDFLRVGYELGQSRVIVGFHYQSDVDAARLCASSSFAVLVTDPIFVQQLELSREELLK